MNLLNKKFKDGNRIMIVLFYDGETHIYAIDENGKYDNFYKVSFVENNLVE